MFLKQDGLPKADVVIIDERFWSASLRGTDHKIHFSPHRLDQLFQVPASNGKGLDPDASMDLHHISHPIYKLVMGDALTPAKLADAGVTAENCRFAARCFYRIAGKVDLSPPFGEASSVLRGAIQRFVKGALSWNPSDPATRPVHGIRAAAGLGKSDVVLEFLAKPEMVGLNVAYYVPGASAFGRA
jgi:hypothetical protein